MSNRIIAKLREPDAIGQMLADCGLDEYHVDIREIRWVTIVVPPGVDTAPIIERLRAHPNVEMAGLAGRVDLCVYHVKANDPLVACDLPMITWHNARMNNYRAWKIAEATLGARGSKSIVIGVIDTGIEPSKPAGAAYWSPNPHPDQVEIPPGDQYFPYVGEYWEDGGNVATYWPGGWGCAPDRVWYIRLDDDRLPWLEDWNGHGTMTASQIGAKAGNGIGISGICPGCRVVVGSGRPFQKERSGQPDISSDLLAACLVGISTRFPNSVLSNSWAAYDINPVAVQHVLDAVNFALAQGCIVVAAGGNEGISKSIATSGADVAGYPATFPGVFTVGCLAAANGGKMGYSNYGPAIDITAPTNIGAVFVPGARVGAYPAFQASDGNWYWSGTGTSSATPVVAGVCALAWSMNPALTGPQVRDLVLRTQSPFLDAATEAYFPGNGKFGFARGIVNAAKAVLCAKSTNPSFAGIVHPYIGFMSRGWTAGQSDSWGSVPAPQTVWHARDSDGNVTERVGNADGSAATVWVEITGYCNGNEADTVELWLGGRRLYSGPPANIQATCASDGAALPVKVVAISGASRSEESYTDVVVSSIVAAVFDPAPFTAECVVSAGMATISGTCNSGVTITVDGVVASKPTDTTWTRTVAASTLGAVMLVSDGTTTVELAPVFEVAPLPGALDVAGIARETGSNVGGSVYLDLGEYVEWIVDAGAGGTFDLTFDTTGAGSVAVSVDRVEVP